MRASTSTSKALVSNPQKIPIIQQQPTHQSNKQRNAKVHSSVPIRNIHSAVLYAGAADFPHHQVHNQ